jgi:hypothetical protein
MTILTIWIILSVLVAFFACSKGCSGFGFLMLSLIFCPLIGFIFVFAVRPKNILFR